MEVILTKDLNQFMTKYNLVKGFWIFCGGINVLTCINWHPCQFMCVWVPMKLWCVYKGWKETLGALPQELSSNLLFEIDFQRPAAHWVGLQARWWDQSCLPLPLMGLLLHFSNFVFCCFLCGYWGLNLGPHIARQEFSNWALSPSRNNFSWCD